MSLDRSVHPLIVTSGVAPPWHTEVPVLPLPGLEVLASERWLRWGTRPVWSLVRGLLRALLSSFKPALLVHDTVVWQALRVAASKFDVPQAIVLRQRKDLDTYFHQYRTRLSTFKLIIVVDEIVPHGPVSALRLPTQIHRVGPIVRHLRNSINPQQARYRYNIPDDCEIVVVTLQGGDFPESADILLNSLQAIECLRGELGEHRIVVVTGPLFDLPSFLATHPEIIALRGLIIVQSDPWLSELLAAARFAVCGGGYNTLAEAVDVGLPVVSVPGLRPFDDGHARARSLAQAGYPVVVADTTVNSILERIRAVLAVPRLPFTPGPSRFKGAEESARAILQLLREAPEPLSPRRQRGSVNSRGSTAAVVDMLAQATQLLEIEDCW